tara:strand:+ start:125 stop:346 length:222 start_codon:yes stop_codon:yes gene_type:complete
MNKLLVIAALMASTSAVRYNDLPDNLYADKIDPLSRYVNDEEMVQLQYNDLPDNLYADKIDPISRYANDEDLH